MQYIVEYEAVDTKFCGIVKSPFSGAPVHITQLCNSQTEAATLVQQFLANTSIQQDIAYKEPVKKCCGR